MTLVRRNPSPASEPERAYRAALRLLAYRPRSRQELEQRLARRFSERAVQHVLDRLGQHHYLNDAAFALFWRQSREAHRPRSAALIRHELQRFGIDREQAETAVAGLDDEESAYRLASHRVRTLRGLDRVTFRRRMGDYLRRRGFAPGTVRRVVQRLWRERDA